MGDYDYPYITSILEPGQRLALHGSRKKTLPHRVLIYLTHSGTSLSPKPLDTCLSTHPTCRLLCCPQPTCLTYHVIYQLLVTYSTHCITLHFAPQEPAVMFRQGEVSWKRLYCCLILSDKEHKEGRVALWLYTNNLLYRTRYPNLHAKTRVQRNK